MPVTETLQGLGEWSLNLSPETPQAILDALTYFGHVAIHAGAVDPRVARDSLLLDSRYVGVYRGSGQNEKLRTLKGVGMAFWLGDEDSKGYVFETPLSVNGLFNVVIPQLLPPSVTAGTIFNVPKTFDFTFQYVSPREALNYVCSTLECAWRINGDGSVDAGLESDLFTVVPEAALVRNERAGKDMFLTAFPGVLATEQDLNDFTTRTVLLANGSEGSVVTATADINPTKNPYKDLFGNAVKLTRMISESETDPTNAPARAQLQLNRFSDTRNAITLSTEDYDLKGDVAVGDYLWVFDPEIGVVDYSNEITFRAERLYPLRLRLTEMSWAVVEGMGVAFRDYNGVWYDLTPYILFESSGSTLTVGGYNRSLTDSGGSMGDRPVQDTSVPGVPTWVTPFVQSVYQSARGESRAQAQLAWTRPNNVDGSTILDGHHFEIRYRTATSPIYPSTHNQISVYTHDQLGLATHQQPISYPAGPWQTLYVPWTDLSALVIDLTPNLPYEAQIRAVDAAKPPNIGNWSALTTWQTTRDTLPPATPAPPTIAASRLAVQMKHTLGRASGGTYNLDLDLHHFEVHGEYEPLFTPSASTLLGKVIANEGMITGQIAAVGSVPIESTAPVYFKVIAVDNDGNKSLPSAAVQATALLVDNAHISDLSVSKVTAGTITATWLMAGMIRTGITGSRMESDANGLRLYNSSNVVTVNLDASTGNATITGTFQSGTAGRRVLINPSGGTVPEIWFEASAGSPRHAYINSLGSGSNDLWLGLNSGPTADSGGFQTSLVLSPGFSMLSYNTVGMPGGPFGSRRGGWVSVNPTDTYVGVNDDSISQEWHYRIDSTGSHYFKGRFAKWQSYGGQGALYVDQVGGSGTSASVSYGATMVTTPYPFTEIQGTSGSPPTASSHAVTARSQTGYSIQYPAGNCDIFVWAIQVQ